MRLSFKYALQLPLPTASLRKSSRELTPAASDEEEPSVADVPSVEPTVGRTAVSRALAVAAELRAHGAPRAAADARAFVDRAEYREPADALEEEPAEDCVGVTAARVAGQQL